MRWTHRLLSHVTWLFEEAPICLTYFILILVGKPSTLALPFLREDSTPKQAAPDTPFLARDVSQTLHHVFITSYGIATISSPQMRYCIP